MVDKSSINVLHEWRYLRLSNSIRAYGEHTPSSMMECPLKNDEGLMSRYHSKNKGQQVPRHLPGQRRIKAIHIGQQSIKSRFLLRRGYRICLYHKTAVNEMVHYPQHTTCLWHIFDLQLENYFNSPWKHQSKLWNGVSHLALATSIYMGI